MYNKISQNISIITQYNSLACSLKINDSKDMNVVSMICLKLFKNKIKCSFQKSCFNVLIIRINVAVQDPSLSRVLLSGQRFCINGTRHISFKVLNVGITLVCRLDVISKNAMFSMLIGLAGTIALLLSNGSARSVGADNAKNVWLQLHPYYPVVCQQ